MCEPRHRAADDVLRLATVQDMERSGRHAEPEWSRPLFDPLRDEDLFDWLGFTAEVG
jgi:hypothetical protein